MVIPNIYAKQLCEITSMHKGEIETPVGPGCNNPGYHYPLIHVY